jgi:hypothetical protein
VRYRPPDELAPDAVSSATGKYFADRGLVYTFVSGKRVDTTHLHLAEWLKAIRNGGRTSCSIEAGFEEAIVAHMATLSFREKKIVYWDRDRERIVSQV